MNIKRKIDQIFLEWKEKTDRKPLIVRGARQIGKTYSIRRFGETYESFIEINFVTNPEFKEIFSEGYSASAITKLISFRNPQARFIPGKTLIFFDELQEYPDCATCLKFFNEDGRFDVICSGSLMGINYKLISSNSVGNKTDLTMHSLDFEEFLWAKGYSQPQIDGMLSHMVNVSPFTQLEMQIMGNLFMEYAVVGGMPEVVEDFLRTGLFSNTLELQRQLLLDYEEDIVKYANGIDKAKIKSVYRHIPVALARDDKKFQITKVAAGARSREYVGCIDWLKDAGVVNVCYCLNFPMLPLKGNYDESKYKLYYHDNGLLMASLDDETSEDLHRNRNLGVYKGAVFENIVAEALVKSNMPLFYYRNSNSQLEMDFFVRTQNSLVPLEVKAKDGATASLNHLLDDKNRYPDIQFGIKLCNRNIGFNGKFYTFPYFCAFLLHRWLHQSLFSRDSGEVHQTW